MTVSDLLEQLVTGLIMPLSLLQVEKIEEARPELYIMNEYKRSLTK